MIDWRFVPFIALVWLASLVLAYVNGCQNTAAEAARYFEEAYKWNKGRTHDPSRSDHTSG